MDKEERYYLFTSPQNKVCRGKWNQTNLFFNLVFNFGKFYFSACSCYKRFSEQKRKWISAKTACESIGAHLVVITSDQENSFLKRWDGWIGLNDRVKEGKWVWVDGSAFKYKNWRSRQPNNIRNQDCGLRTGSGKWFDNKCDEYQSYICESPTS